MTLSTPETANTLLSLAAAVGIGLLVGMQREWERNRVAGIRTFALVSLFGALSALIALSFGGWIVAAAVVALAGLVILGNVAGATKGNRETGLTTEVALFVIFAAGALTMMGRLTLAVVVAGVVMVLLQGKSTLHKTVYNIGRDDLREIARLVLIGLVILPILPNQAYGPLGVLNPFSIWLMVVLIVGISLAAHLASKFLGNRQGMIVGGLLGGLISSTAATTSLARQSVSNGKASARLAVMTLMAGAVVFGRVIFEVFIAAPKSAPALIPPLGAMLVAMSLTAFLTFRLVRATADASVPSRPPSQFKSAVWFALLYALVLLGVAFAKQRFGDSGLFVVAVISGLTDMDAITLSTANLTEAGHVDPGTAWRVILSGGMSNMAFKSALAVAFGGRAYFKIVTIAFALALVAGGGILFFWP